MPRLLPRILEKLAQQPLTTEFDAFKHKITRKKRSLYKPNPPRPSFDPAKYPRSILLNPLNPIVNGHEFTRHKKLPPVVRINWRNWNKGTNDEKMRAMNIEERRWWANPYLRMLGSPFRRDIASDVFIPTDFLIRLGCMRIAHRRVINSKISMTTIIPDGLEHTKFRARRAGRAVYSLCSKSAIGNLPIAEVHRAFPSAYPDLSLAKQTGHLLRLRVLQELELLAEHLQGNLHAELFTSPCVRRLSRAEWNYVKETNTIPYSNAVAVLVVPTLNRDPETKKRPEGSMSNMPLPDEPVIDPKRPTPPVSVLLPIASSLGTQLPPGVDPLPHHQIPLYNGVPLFPHRAQRATLHDLLSRLCHIEANAKFQANAKTAREKESIHRETSPIAKNDKKASHAFLLCVDENIIQRADMAAVAIALWRLRMFEDISDDTHSKWSLRQPYRSLDRWE